MVIGGIELRMRTAMLTSRSTRAFWAIGDSVGSLALITSSSRSKLGLAASLIALMPASSGVSLSAANRALAPQVASATRAARPGVAILASAGTVATAWQGAG